MISPADSAEVKQAFLAADTWILGSHRFAGGTDANNKLEAEKLFEHPRELAVVIGALAKQVARHEPDAIYGVPNGGQLFAEEVAKELDIPMVRLAKNRTTLPWQKSFYYESGGDMTLARSLKRLVGVEDVTTEFTSLQGALRLPGLDEHTIAIEAIWRRGTSSSERSLSVPISWLVEEPLPNIISHDHPFYVANRHQAVIA